MSYLATLLLFLTPLQEKPEPPGLTVVIAEPASTVPLTASAMAKLPRKSLKVPGRDGETNEYEGVPLVEVLKLAKVPVGEELRGRAIAPVVVIAEAPDKAKAVYALAEIDPAFTDKLILLADKKDGKPLSADEGPYRMLVPTDKRHARWLRQIIKLEVRKM